MTVKSLPIPASQARAIWLRAQRLDTPAPFGEGPVAVKSAVEHLGYVQIDTINVVERSHHHILFSRIPGYKLADLDRAQSADKSVFEYWTHALAYVPSADYKFYVAAMDQFRTVPHSSFAGVSDIDYAALLERVRALGALSIRDIDDDVLAAKTHPWGSRKPSRKALRFGFFIGDLAISKRTGMLKSYELSDRHFGWSMRPDPVSPEAFAEYLLRRGLRSQGLVSLDSVCYGNTGSKRLVHNLIEASVKKDQLIAVHIEGLPKPQHWVEPEILAGSGKQVSSRPIHILSPFDPLIIQRKRLSHFFGYEHRFEAYIAAEKRILGYFALPVLVGDEIVAVIDFKVNRLAGALNIQKWTWVVDERPELLQAIEEKLQYFERFQLKS